VSSIIPLDSRKDGPLEVLYESPTTRVFRQRHAGASVVCKEPLGADAALRVNHEKYIIARLAGVVGVAQLAAGTYPVGVLALQDCGGLSLAQLLRAGPMDLTALLTLAPQLALALAAMHRAGVIHLDINPANILLSNDGEPVLIDFNLAVLADQQPGLTHPDRIVGTLGYVAPEQTGRTGRTVDQRADLYAVGATLYEMATGSPPFKGADALQLIHDTLVREPVAPSQVDPRVPLGLSDIILHLLAKAPEQRYQSAEGLLHDLRRLRGEPEKGPGRPFKLGERDFAARLVAPARLVGRGPELSMLRTALADALCTPRRTVLIEGAAGVGKSALINELRPVVSAAGGWFVSVKFDQYQKDGARTEAMTQALRALGRMLLAQPASEVATQRRRILDKLGRSAALITHLLPEFALLLGPQPELVEVDPRQAELRLQQVAVDLLGAVASPERPLVMVLDDLQWAGAVSLRAFERAMTDPGPRGLLLVGAYRADGVFDPNQVLPLMLAQWRQLPYAPIYVALPTLSAEEIGELLGQMLKLRRQPAQRLARAVGTLTRGNPFDTVELINTLRTEGVLSLREEGWHWDEAAITHFVGKGDVVDLLAARIGGLPVASRQLLEFMSYLGNSVDFKLLGAAAGLDKVELQARLRAPLADGLLLADRSGGHDGVQFRHDRVQQAVLGALDDAQRSQMQLVMARRLARHPSLESDAAQQYMACVRNLRQAEEKRRAAQLFYGLAQKLAKSATYLLVERYLAAADALLAPIAGPADANLRGRIDVARHAALYSLGRLDESDSLYSIIQVRAGNPLELVDATCMQMRTLCERLRVTDALGLGTSLLGRLGLDVPADLAAAEIGQRLNALDEWVRQDSLIDHSKRPQTHDERLRAVAKLLGQCAQAASIRLDVKTLAWVLLESQRLWTEHGPCPELVANLGLMSVVLIALRQDYRSAFHFSRHILKVGEALGCEPQTASARHIFSAHACHWIEPAETVLQHLKLAFEGLHPAGTVAYVQTLVITLSLDIAPILDVCAAEIEVGIALSQGTGNVHTVVLHTCFRQLIRALRGHAVETGRHDEELSNEMTVLDRVGPLPYLELTRALGALLLGNRNALIEHAVLGRSLQTNIPAYYITVYGHFLTAMARAWQIQADPHIVDRAAVLAELSECHHWLAARAADQPYNFLHLVLLVEAEQAWALGDLWKAGAAFDAAQVQAESRQRPWHLALITERAALFHLAHGFEHAGHKLLVAARDHYQAWGAFAKVDQMQREHAFLRMPGKQMHHSDIAIADEVKGSNPISPDALDLVGVLRASQALSSETSLEQLTARVTEVLAALTGATKVMVLSWNEGQWRLQAPAPGEPSMSVAQAGEHGLLPLSAFSYAERTGETLVVDDAPHDDRFSRDPYFAGVPLCSLLVVPIAGQGAARAMLGLENRLGRAAFNAQRLDAVMLIAGQLAVSLANAQLYESLEHRVAARTRELQETQARLVATARRAGKAEIANNVLHNVGNVLNSVNVSANVVRRTISQSRAQGLARAVALMNEHAHELGQFIDSDPRGKVLLTYLNELVGAIQAERDHALGDLDRLTRSVEHISHVVATQQTHTGPSSLLEIARPQELVEEALRLSAEATSRLGVSVVRRYEEVPATALDGPRVLQILVNVISNAAQAMQGLPEGSRQLTLGTGLVSGEGARRLHITVRDQGEGIAPENLTRIFAHGFTTRKNGHGFGLHASALAAVEMRGRLTVHSDGPGKGAVFTLELPLEPAGGMR
jgi:predicted ATPase/signal transduction histidine kinase